MTKPKKTPAQKTGENIVAQRKRLGWTQEDLVAKSGLHPRSITRWECGKSLPSGRVLAKLAKAFKVEIFMLMK